MEVVGQEWSPAAEAAWVVEVRREYRADAAEELDCNPAATDGAWLSWEQIHAVEHSQAGDPGRYAGGRTVIGNDIARQRHLWVASVLKLVGDVAWTRQLVELKDTSFAEPDDTLDELVDRYRPTRVAMDQAGMAEKPVEDAQRRYGAQRVEGVLMTPAVRLELVGAFKLRIPVKSITHSGRNRSLIPVETDHPFRPKPITRSERGDAGLNHESRFSRFFSPPVSGVIAWNLPSCRVVDMVFVSAGTERREGSAPVGRGRPGALPDSMKKDDGLWALWETALFAVFQAPVGALFASIGAPASTAPRGGAGSGA